jgi:hypothetical protein
VGGESVRTLPGDWPLVLGRCNYDTLIPKHRSNAGVIDLWPTDLVVVIVKQIAGEGVAMHLRVKLFVSAKEAAEIKGKTCKRDEVFI